MESGVLLQETVEPIPQEQLNRAAALQRLRTARGTVITPADLAGLLADILKVLDP